MQYVRDTSSRSHRKHDRDSLPHHCPQKSMLFVVLQRKDDRSDIIVSLGAKGEGGLLRFAKMLTSSPLKELVSKKRRKARTPGGQSPCPS